MNIFVTGSTGFLGGHIVKSLTKHNHCVFALVRKGSRIDLPALPLIKLCYGDLSDIEILTDHLGGMDAVIHAAADTTLGTLIHVNQFETNVTGTANLIKASQQSGVKRFIHISTANVFNPGTRAFPGTEANRVRMSKSLLPYIQTKMQAEDILKLEVIRENFPALILNPTFMIGPEDYKPSSGKLVLAILKKRLRFYPHGGKNIVDVRDVADAALHALTMGSIGENYLIANENTSYKDLISNVYQEIQCKREIAKLPGILLRHVGTLGTAMEHLTRKPITVNHLTAKMASEFHYYSNDKARAALTFIPRPFHETLTETVNWLTHEHLAH